MFDKTNTWLYYREVAKSLQKNLNGGEGIVQLLNPHEYKEIIHKQGRNMSWVCRQLECSYSLLYQFLKGDKPMKQERIEKLHKVLGIE